MEPCLSPTLRGKKFPDAQIGQTLCQFYSSWRHEPNGGVRFYNRGLNFSSNFYMILQMSILNVRADVLMVIDAIRFGGTVGQ